MTQSLLQSSESRKQIARPRLCSYYESAILITMPTTVRKRSRLRIHTKMPTWNMEVCWCFSLAKSLQCRLLVNANDTSNTFNFIKINFRHRASSRFTPRYENRSVLSPNWLLAIQSDMSRGETKTFFAHKFRFSRKKERQNYECLVKRKKKSNFLR